MHQRVSRLARSVWRTALNGVDQTDTPLSAPVSIFLVYSTGPPSTSTNSGTRPRMKVRKPGPKLNETTADATGRRSSCQIMKVGNISWVAAGSPGLCQPRFSQEHNLWFILAAHVWLNRRTNSCKFHRNTSPSKALHPTIFCGGRRQTLSAGIMKYPAAKVTPRKTYFTPTISFPQFRFKVLFNLLLRS